MVETAAHQVDHVFPKVPVRQWVLLEAHGVENMKTWNGGGGFSVNGSAHIHENDREGLERLIRYCARPPFSMERITKQPDGSCQFS